MSDGASGARKSFGLKLRDLRRDAGLSGREFARATGLHNTKISRIEHGRQYPSEEDIRRWCIACGVARRIDELIAIHREVEQMWKEYRRDLRKGQRHVQERSGELYARTGLLRAYEAIVVPGILQTAGYIRAVLTINAELHDLPLDEVAGAVEARLSRQGLLTRGDGTNNYSFVIEASVLSNWFGGADVMRDQLNFLEAATRLPNVALGLIPPGHRTIWGGECFYIFDDELVRSEMWTGSFRTSQSTDIAFFEQAFERLRSNAVYGDAARQLIATQLENLQTSENP
ncbi:helix-turn-helix domain-containing protein [Kribbella solani]|uniref:Transcriptional regulator with XRE-family HTH domain n=1 Tax=Kribbella solani TaxID=236067 RepID=A0A841DPR1_9ACTN|nr:helix-turn-helix transcriptional regulator [Kribbella solani]MBB5980643.1 transcriptional regulator with XRE-family HTH domain [Kribbella solani]